MPTGVMSWLRNTENESKSVREAEGLRKRSLTHAKDGTHDPLVPALAGSKLQLADTRAKREALEQLVEDDLSKEG